MLWFRCKCKLAWEAVQKYRKHSHTSIPIVRVPSKGLSRLKRKSVPKLPLAVAPKQQDMVDGNLSPSERSRSASPSNRHAIRSKWLSDPSMHLSFDYAKSQINAPTSSTLPSTSSTANPVDDSQTTSNSREHIPKIVYHKSFQARIARNYYKLQHTTLFVAFCINLLLLTAKVSIECHSKIYYNGVHYIA